MALQIAMPKLEWSDLPTDLLGLILKKLDLFDLFRFRWVCCSWNLAVQSYMASHSYTSPPQNPWLMRLDEDDGKANISFLSQEGNKVFQVNNVFGELAWCFGSTKGWLVILDRTKILNLVNPLSGGKIQLPLVPKYNGLDYYPKKYNGRLPTRPYITKAVLLSDPTRTKDFAIVVRYRYIGRLTFCKFGDNKWTEFGGKKYHDMICHSSNGQLVVAYGNLVVEVWDFQGAFPTKVGRFRSSSRPLVPPQVKTLVGTVVHSKMAKDLYFQFYLVESMGEILVLLRLAFLYTGTEDSSTFTFAAFKVDYSGKEFGMVYNLVGRALFISRNESVSTTTHPQYKENSIYFTEDYYPNDNARKIGVCNLGDAITNIIDIQPSNCSWCTWFVPS
ncbi:hypothetical protein FNV43_RR04087 [Rhamnella rubrinervis]|uniref:F-box domain-containing protein n=1 Tax=Rhamnella rubrinervis TaxID=2594499 RepID=A0A8K0HIX0_9ROSA|nr:hypothetical protein FNV43_RR04087 [Rhamnella rubrinervis]